MIVRRQLRKQYGMGFKYYQKGDGFFDTVKKYGFPPLKYLFRFVKNNLPEIIQITKNVISKHDKRPSFKEVVRDVKEDPNFEKIKNKPLTQHINGDGLSKKGLSKKSKNILKNLSIGGGLKILT